MASLREYVVVVRAPASARFLPGQGQEIFIPAQDKVPHPLRVRMRTRWVDEGFSSPVPRELWVEILGQSDSLDNAMSLFGAVARPFTALLAFCCNTRVGTPEVHLAYDVTPGLTEHEFLEVFLPDERGLVQEGRRVRTDEFAALIDALLRSSEPERLSRSLQQYELALRNWYFGGEWLALAHLYIAVEILTPAILRLEQKERGVNEATLARSVDIDPDDPERPRWRPALETWCRKEIIFGGDASTYNTAKGASDGIEHGYMDLNDVHRAATSSAEATFRHVRLSMLRLLGTKSDDFPDLFDRLPQDVQSFRKMVRGHFIGDRDDIAAPNEEYPSLRWLSSIDDIRRENDDLNVTFREKLTVQCADEVSFKGHSFEYRGRQRPGAPSFDPDSQPSAAVSITPPASRPDFHAAMSRANAHASRVGAAGRTVGMSGLRVNAFGLFSQQIALFEAVHVLLLDNRPVECASFVEGLIVNTGTLEAIEQAPSVDGALIRLKLDSMDIGGEILTSDAEILSRIEAKGQELTNFAVENGIAIPGVVDHASTQFVRDHDENLRIVRAVGRWDHIAVAQHMREEDGEPAFRTQVIEPDTIAVIASVCIRSLAQSTIIIAKLLSWLCDSVCQWPGCGPRFWPGESPHFSG